MIVLIKLINEGTNVALYITAIINIEHLEILQAQQTVIALVMQHF